MRSYLRRLVELGLVQRHREDDFPGSVSYVITPRGERLLAVGNVLQVWLRSAPEGEMELGSTASKSVVKALVDGWSTGLVRALAARPLGLTELNRVIPQVSYPTLERRLTAMRQVGLIAPEREGNGRVTRCAVTQWLRDAVAPLTAAVGWESTCIPDQTPAPSRIDAEAAFLLATPTLELPAEIHGVCRLAVEFRRGSELDFAGVTIRIVEGKVESCVARIDGRPDAWATGSVLDWFRWMRDMDGHRVEIGGDPTIANAVADALRSGYLASSGK
jgi:DNA-binding HxlR family transcriptional regulator